MIIIIYVRIRVLHVKSIYIGHQIPLIVREGQKVFLTFSQKCDVIEEHYCNFCSRRPKIVHKQLNLKHRKMCLKMHSGVNNTSAVSLILVSNSIHAPQHCPPG
jgi:hypothetical protein